MKYQQVTDLMTNESYWVDENGVPIPFVPGEYEYLAKLEEAEHDDSQSKGKGYCGFVEWY